MFATSRVIIVLLIAITVCAAGCKRGDRSGKPNNAGDAGNDDPIEPTRASDPVAKDLQKMAVAYHDFQDAQKRPPQSFAELNGKFPVPSRCAQATVFWGTDVWKCEAGAVNTVLGWLPNPGGRGKVCVMCDGGIRLMTDQEYDKAYKGKPPTK